MRFTTEMVLESTLLAFPTTEGKTNKQKRSTYRAAIKLAKYNKEAKQYGSMKFITKQNWDDVIKVLNKMIREAKDID
jgi:hypothetical protein